MKNPEEFQIFIRAILDPRLELLRVQNTHIYVMVKERMLTGERGHLVLEAEKTLRRATGQPLEVFLEPKGDMNKLRQQLRGVTVSSVLPELRDKTYNGRYEENEPSKNQTRGKGPDER